MAAKKTIAAISGAAFLMATSAIGPGFINNTVLFTGRLAASFGFVILVSVILDILAQLNIWRIITVKGKYAQQIAGETSSFSGLLLTLLVAGGGFMFNVGNIAGAALGLQVLTGCSLTVGALISVAIALAIFLVKQAAPVIDVFVKALGLLMILLTLYVCWQSQPDIPEALLRTVAPGTVDTMMIVTIVGGTVGGYISFSGAHRLLDAGISGQSHLKQVTRGAVYGISIASIMRYILFLAAFGVVGSGVVLDKGNPAQTVFQSAAGTAGVKMFGLVLWSAAITSVVGSAFTSVSFLKTLHPAVGKNTNPATIIFILCSAIVFLIFGNPVQLLQKAGAVNGIILPLALAIMLRSVRRNASSVDYRHPRWLLIGGWLVVAVMTWMCLVTLLRL